MTLSRHTRLLILLGVAVVAVFLVSIAMAPGLLAAQETTTSATEEILTAFDTPAVSEMAETAKQNSQRRDELEEEIEALEAEYEYGPERDALRDELAEMPASDDEADALASARLADIAAGRLPGPAKEKAAELRRKAQSAAAVDASLQNVNLDTTHENYVLFGDSPARKMAKTYRQEAAVLEVSAESEGAAREAVPEEEATEEETAAGGDKPAPEEDPAPAPDEASPEPAPAEPENSGPGIAGFLPDINLVPILAFIGLIGAAIFALSRAGGMSIRGFFSPAMASVPKPKKRPASKPKPSKPKPKTKAAAKTRPSKPGPNLEDEPEEAETKPKTPDDEIPDVAFDSEELQKWFDAPAPGETPDQATDDQNDEPPV